MNTNNLKRFAKEARIKLLDQVGRKLEFVLTHDTAELRGKQKEIEQLKRKITEQGKEQVVETVAYTWFNRLMALRFMDANGYTIPKVVTPLPGMTNPEILQNALGGNVEADLKLDRQRLNDLLDGKTAATDAHTEAYKMLLVASCNQWHTAMPFMFERISDYTELLLPDDLLSDYSIVADIRNGMSDEDCQQEELIGWLYQFYIADKKDDVFEGLKKNIKITADNIPAATQLFTPRWIVRYMVENTLGKLWLSLRPNSKLRDHMPYYIESPEQPTTNNQQPIPEDLLTTTNHQLATKITFLDPCQGSGHVLVYAFDLFTKIYEEEGYNTNEIPALILEHNLFGIDIDERAAQLAAFALTMKARSYYTRFLRKPVQPHVIALENVNEDIIKHAVKLPLQVAGKLVYDYRDLTLYNLTQADNFGSLIQIDPEELKALSIQKGSIWQEQEQKLKEQAEYLSRQYHCVVTNPPYMGTKGMNHELIKFAKKHYANSATDLFAMFIERSLSLCSIYASLVTIQNWMFLSSFEKFRISLLNNTQISSLIHIGFNSFPELNSKFALAAAFVLVKSENDLIGSFFDLNSASKSANKQEVFEEKLAQKFSYHVDRNQFKAIPGNPINYWAGKGTLKAFQKYPPLGNLLDVRQGMATTDNKTYLRLWHEISIGKIAFGQRNALEANNLGINWFPYNKGGDYRKWFGNNNYIILYKNNGEDLIKMVREKYPKISDPEFVIKNRKYYFRESITWSFVGLLFGTRYSDSGFIFDVGGSSAFCESKSDLLYFTGLLCSKLSNYFLQSLNPSLNFQVENVQSIPSMKVDKEFESEVIGLVNENIEIAKDDWNSFENSWAFSNNPLLRLTSRKSYPLNKLIYELQRISEKKIIRMKDNEERLNRIFIKLYQLQDEVEPEIPISDVTLTCNPAFRYGSDNDNNEQATILLVDTINDLISHCVGVLYGRYSLDKPGLILANQGETLQDFLQQVPSPTFMPDKDNIVPVLDGEWFNDDIVGRFKVFLKAAFGEEYFEDNLKYIEDTIGKDIRKYFVKDFYNDHIKRYKKRPIYWMFSSPKGHFKALIYMHRYQPDLCSKMLNDYLQAFISKLEAAKQTQTMLSLREDLSAREKTAAIKEIDKLELMLKDCREYEKTLFTIATQKISIDLDDGVKVNYQKFKEVLVPIKGLDLVDS